MKVSKTYFSLSTARVDSTYKLVQVEEAVFRIDDDFEYQFIANEYNTTSENMDAEKLPPFSDNSFDIVCSADLFVRKSKEALKPLI